jgi:hypothetical protein
MMEDTTAKRAPIGAKIALSREEVYLIMRLWEAEAIPGYDLAWVQKTPAGALPEKVEGAIEAATTALIARGYLVPGPKPAEGEKLKLDVLEPVLALVGACAFGDYSILLILHGEQARKQIYLHEWRNLGVAHTLPYVNVHLFEALKGRAEVLALVDRTLGLHNQQKVPVPEGKASAAIVEAARDLALAGEPIRAIEILVEGGLPLPTAEALVNAIQTATALGSVTIARRPGAQERKVGSLALAVTPEICFMLIPDQGIYQIRAVSAVDMRRWIRTQLVTVA